MKLQAVFYANPDRYPPIINSMRLLAEAGYEIEIFCRATSEKSNIVYPTNVQVQRIESASGNSLYEYGLFLAKVLRRGRRSTSLFIGHDIHGFLPARLLATFYRRPLLYQSHELIDSVDQLSTGARLIFAFHKYFAKSSNIMVVPDMDRATILKDLLKLDKDPLVAANSPLMCAKMCANNVENRLQSTLQSRGFNFEQIVFRQGSIGPSHAIEATIRSIPLWQNPRWGFVIMGPGSDDYIKSIQELAQDIGVSDRFVILPAVPYSEIFTFTSSANLGHSLYSPVDSNNRFSTTASNKLMEYMSAGLPILVSDRPGLRRLIEHYNCGIAADESQPVAIAAAVNTLLGEPERAKQMGQNALCAFKDEFRYDKQFAPVMQKIDELIGKE